MTTVAQLFQQSGLWQWFSSNVTQGYNPPTEYGADFSTTLGTPIGAIAGGTVVQNYSNPGTSINNQLLIASPSGAVWEYQHINSSLQPGASIQPGQIIGTENGQPTTSSDPYSTGPHIEVRYSPTYNASLGIGQAWQDPTSAFAQASQATVNGTGGSDPIQSALQGAGGILATGAQATTTGAVNATGFNLLSSLGISQTANWQDIGIRTGLIILGAILIIIAVAKLLQKPSVVVEEK